MTQTNEEQLRKELSDALQRISELEKSLYERNRVEGAVRGSEESYRKFVENAHDVLWVFDLNLGYTYVSPSVKLLRGCTVEEAMNQGLDEILTPASAKKARELFEREKLLELGGHHHDPDWSYTTDFEMIHKDGSTFWAEMTMNALYDEEGRIKGILGITRDISERKKAEDELKRHRDRLEEMVEERTLELSQTVEQLKKEIAERREAEEKLRRSEEQHEVYFSFSNDVMFSYDNQFLLKMVTPNVERILGYKPEEMVGKTFLDLGVLHPDSVNAALGNALKVLSGETVYSQIYEFITKDGESRFGEVSGVPLMRDGKLEAEVTVARDITERLRMQKSLKESEERYRTTLQTLPDAVSILSVQDSRYIYVNDAFCRITGFSLEEIIGRTPMELGLPATQEDSDHCAEILGSTEPVSNRGCRCRTKGGALLDTIISACRTVYGSEPCTVMVLTDITALKQIEEEKKRAEIKSQKMEAVGTLAAGIAHDFNNILTTILGYARMSMKDFMAARKEDRKLTAVRSDLDELNNAAYRARDLVNHILAFSRHSEKDYSPIRLGATVRESLKWLRPSIPTNIRITEDIEDSQFILGDQAQIHIVMTNLCTNAAYAMDKNGGTLEVSVRPISSGDVPADLDVPEGPCLRIAVRDTGCGMSPQTMARIFDPYFTTKGKGQGTGLGLSVIHGIVNSHGGTISCRSLPSEGTTFEIYLPQFEFTEEGFAEWLETAHPDGGSRVLDLDSDRPRVETGEKKRKGKGVQSDLDKP